MVSKNFEKIGKNEYSDLLKMLAIHFPYLKNTNPKLLMKFYVLIDMHEKCMTSIFPLKKLNDYDLLLARVVNLSFLSISEKRLLEKQPRFVIRKLKNIRQVMVLALQNPKLET